MTGGEGFNVPVVTFSVTFMRGSLLEKRASRPYLWDMEDAGQPTPTHISSPLPVVPGDVVEEEVKRLLVIEAGAQSLLMSALSSLGKGVGSVLSPLPAGQAAAVERAVRQGLEMSYRLAEQSHGLGGGRRFHTAVATAAGAVGGLGGVPATLIELPATITMMFRAVQSVARAHGEEMDSTETRIACLEVFGKGGPRVADDGADTGYLSVRLGASQAVPAVVAAVAPRLATVLGQKVAAQAVPVAGAMAGAAVNYAFMDYYQTMAEVQFGLRKLRRKHGAERVDAALKAQLALQETG